MNKHFRWLAVAFMLASCGGGGGDGGGGGPAPQAKVSLLGDWNQIFVLTDCGATEFHRLITFFSDNGDTAKVGIMRDQGEFPTVRGGGVCDMTSFSTDYNFSPYPSNQDATQFDEMFSLKAGWSYKTLTVSEFSASRIVLVRELDDGRIWKYVFTR